MSRHPSPPPNSNHSRLFDSASTVRQQLPQSQSQSQSQQPKGKMYQVGIAAGAEDVKYHAKYKELKRKVKEIEGDNDKLHFKVLQVKRSIQRMSLERAVLYERLTVVPPSPELVPDRALPSPTSIHPTAIHTGPGVIPPPQVQPPSHNPQYLEQSNSLSRSHNANAPPVSSEDQALIDYIQTHGNARVVPGPDGRPMPVMETPMGPGVAPSTHGITVLHTSSSRRPSNGSALGHDASRPPHLPPFQQMPVQQQQQHYEPPPPGRGHHQNHSQSRPQSHNTSPIVHHPQPPLERTRSQSSAASRSRNQSQPQSQPYNPHAPQYPEPLSAVHVIHSPPLSDRERERERSLQSRRHDVLELAGSPHTHSSSSRHPSSTPLATVSPRTDARQPPSAAGPRIHNHQRLGPGTYINRGNDHHEREYEHERDWDREPPRGREAPPQLGLAHMQSPSMARSNSRSQQIADREYQEQQHHHQQQQHQQQQHQQQQQQQQQHPSASSSRMMRERERDEPVYYPSEPYSHSNMHQRRNVSVSRSPSPLSGSGSVSGDGEDISRPNSRNAQYYDYERERERERELMDRPRSFRLRPVQPNPNEDTGTSTDFVHAKEDGRPQLQVQTHPSHSHSHSHSRSHSHSQPNRGGAAGGSGGASGGGGGGGGAFGGFQGSEGSTSMGPGPSRGNAPESGRKRNRNDMDVEDELEGQGLTRGGGRGRGGGGRGILYTEAHLPDAHERDRGTSKRFHRDTSRHVRGGEEDGRMD